jgi:hypothetical protein
MNNEVACVQRGYLDIHQRDAVVIAQVDHSIVAAIRRLEQRLRMAGLHFVQSRL